MSSASTQMQKLWLETPSPPATPVRFVSQCQEPGCTTWTFGDSQREADNRITVHRGQFHSFSTEIAPTGERSCPPS
jgi:hypothetical protein